MKEMNPLKRAATLFAVTLMVGLLTVQAHAASLYPVSVEEYTYGPFDELRIDKVYELSRSDDPADIPTEDFDRGGYHFTLLDVVKTVQGETDTKDYIEVVTLDSDTKDVGEIIKKLEPEREITTEDGYTGILKPDYTKITVEAAGYKTSSWTVTATRTYPNLSDADASLIPKTITDNGRTLTLADVQWQEAGTFYNATATYTGTASGRSVTGYTVTVEYSGEVTKTTCDTIIYTATFAAVNTSHGETHFEPEATPTPTLAPEGGDSQPEPTEAPAPDSGGNIAGKIAVTAIAGIAALALVGYGGWRGYKYIRDKKRGYV